jgi:hypothetical protein
MYNTNMKRKSKRTGILKKADVILIASVLCAALIAFLLQLTVFAGTYSSGAAVEITLDGELYGIYPLGSPREIKVDDGFDNVVAITKDKDGGMSVSMKSADCPGQDCVRHAPISLSGQAIVCLPAKLIVEIKDGDDDIDGYTY